MIALGPRHYVLNGAELNAAAARLFYSYQPATFAADSAPLFVLTGGGPGAAMLFLLGFSGPYKLNGSEPGAVTENGDAWTDLAHLLFIDARNAGLSHAVLSDATDEVQRRAQFTADNYNVYQDSADVLSALLRFLGNHPKLAARDIYLVGQSYGGLRTTVMLSFLLDYQAYANQERPFHSQELSAEIARFWQKQAGQLPTKEQVAARFRGQILLQPVIAGARQDQAAGMLFEQPGSIVEELAAAAGVTYVRCSEQPKPCDSLANAHKLLEQLDRSRYDVRVDAKWLERHLAAVTHTATDPAALAMLLDTSEERLGAVLRAERQVAYRFGAASFSDNAVRGTLETAFGSVQPFDNYFLSLNYEVLNTFYSPRVTFLQAGRNADIFGTMFLHNVRYIETMITRAAHDLEIYGKALPGALASYPELNEAFELNEPERLSLHYADGSVRMLFSPTYSESSHAVARDEPAKLHADIESFLNERRVPPR